jgi:hypothetical protein
VKERSEGDGDGCIAKNFFFLVRAGLPLWGELLQERGAAVTNTDIFSTSVSCFNGN